MKYLACVVAFVVLFSITSDASAQCRRPLRNLVHRTVHRVHRDTSCAVQASVCATRQVACTARQVVDVATPNLELRRVNGNCQNGVCTPVQQLSPRK